MRIDLVPLRCREAAGPLDEHNLTDEIHIESLRRCIPMEKSVKPPLGRDRNNEALARSRTPRNRRQANIGGVRRPERLTVR
jgi:hypothetical protein